MTTLCFRHTTTHRRFRVVQWDRTTNTVTLQGDIATFTQPFDKVLFKRLGYVLEPFPTTPSE